MKRILKMIGSMLLGAVIGLTAAALVMTLFTDMTPAEFMTKLQHVKISETAFVFVLSIVTFIVGLWLNLMLHEAGHLVGGLLTGYKFVSFRIFKWTFIRQDGKLRIKHFSVNGTGGQCLLSPPDGDPTQIPTLLYNMGGILSGLLCLLIAAPFFWIIDNPFAKVALSMFCLADVFILLMNGIPMKVGGICNDAYNQLELRHPASRRALAIQLRANAEIQQGTRPCQLPEEWFICDNGDDCYSNSLLLALKVYHAGWLLDCGRWEEAYSEHQEIYAHRDKVMGLYIMETACELIFLSLALGDTEYAKTLYSDKMKQYIRQYRKVMSSKERVLFAIALCLEQDKEQAKAIYQSLQTRRDNYLMQGEVESDLALMQRLAGQEGLAL